MNVRAVISTVNQMQADGVIDCYAIGGAVGATFYLEPVATMDVDIFVALHPRPGELLVSPQAIFEYLRARGHAVEGEYIMIEGWPVQFLAPAGPLGDEALSEALTADVDGVPARVFSAEHLAAIALQTGRAKDKARLLQFIESNALDPAKFESIVTKHGLLEFWKKFRQQFIEDPQ